MIYRYVLVRLFRVMLWLFASAWFQHIATFCQQELNGFQQAKTAIRINWPLFCPSVPSFVFAVICKCSFTAFMGFSLYHQERKLEFREKRPVYPSGYVNFTKGIFRPIIRLKLMGSWFPDRSANMYSVLSRENLTITVQCILHCLLWASPELTLWSFFKDCGRLRNYTSVQLQPL